MLVRWIKPRSSGPQRYGVEQLGPAGAGLLPDPQLLQWLQTLSKSAQVPAGTAFLNAPRAPCATSPEAAHSPRPPTRSCALLGAAFASRPSETQVRDAQEQRQGATKSPSAARRRSRPEARSGRRRGREYLLLAGLRAEKTWGCSATPARPWPSCSSMCSEKEKKSGEMMSVAGGGGAGPGGPGGGGQVPVAS